MVPADSSLRYYCGCGSGEVRGDLSLCASRPGQQYHTPQGEELDWPMGKLSDANVRRVLMGLVTGLGLAASVVASTLRESPQRGSGSGPARHHHSSSSSSFSSSLSSSHEQISFHPQMQSLGGDGAAVEWAETWLIAFPIVTIKVLWRLQGATARVSAHQYSIVSEYLQACNAELSEMSAAASSGSEDGGWDFGQMELQPSSGEVSYIIPYNAAGDLIAELSPLIEYNHQLAKKMFIRFVAPLVRLMATGNEAVLGLRTSGATNGNAYFTPTLQSAAAAVSAGIGGLHPLHHQHLQHVSTNGIAASDQQSMSAADDSTDFLPADSPPAEPPAAAPAAAAAATSAPPSSSPPDSEGDVDLSAEHLSSLGFEIIPSHNLDLPVNPSLVKTGGGAVVIRGSTVSDGTPIAFKMMHHQDELQYDHRLRREFLDEALMLKRAAHSRIVQFMGLCLAPYGLVTELLDTSLYDVLYLQRRALTDAEIATIALEVCRGVAYLHGKSPSPIIHRDIKSHNILLNRHLSTCKICDLGIARTKEQLRRQWESGEVDGLGSLAWMSPEGLDQLRHFDFLQLEKQDVYSIGCLLYEMLFGRIPWSTAESPHFPPPAASIIAQLEAGHRPQMSLQELSQRSSMPQIWYSLLDKCLSHAPQQRPQVVELVQTFSKIVKVCEKEQNSNDSNTAQPPAARSSPASPPAPIAAISVLPPNRASAVSFSSLPVPSSPKTGSPSSNNSKHQHSPLRVPIFHRDTQPDEPLTVASDTPLPLPLSAALAADGAVNGTPRKAVERAEKAGRGGEGRKRAGRHERGGSGGDEDTRIHFSPPSTPSTASNNEAPTTPPTPTQLQAQSDTP